VSRGRVRTASGDPQAGLADLDRCAELLEAYRSPALSSWRPHAGASRGGPHERRPHPAGHRLDQGDGRPRVEVAAVIGATTLLPALLGALGPRIHSLRVKLGRTHPDDHKPHGWARWARGVARRPWISLVAATAVLVVLALPLLNLHLGQSDTGAMPESTHRASGLWRAHEGLRRRRERPAARGCGARLAREARPEEPERDRQEAEAARPAATADRAVGPDAGGDPATGAGGGAAADPVAVGQARAGEEERAEPGHGPAPDEALGSDREDAEREIGLAAGARQARQRGGLHRDLEVGAVGRPDGGPRQPAARRDDPAGDEGHGRDRVDRRPDRRLHRPCEPHQRPTAGDDPDRRRAQLRGADAGLPLARRAGEGGAHEPALGGRGNTAS
jgi:hypothetical protein